MPYSFLTGNIQMRCSISCSEIVVRPSGFCKSEAILARSLFGTIPMEQDRPVASSSRRSHSKYVMRFIARINLLIVPFYAVTGVKPAGLDPFSLPYLLEKIEKHRFMVKLV